MTLRSVPPVFLKEEYLEIQQHQKHIVFFFLLCVPFFLVVLKTRYIITPNETTLFISGVAPSCRSSVFMCSVIRFCAKLPLIGIRRINLVRPELIKLRCEKLCSHSSFRSRYLCLWTSRFRVVCTVLRYWQDFITNFYKVISKWIIKKLMFQFPRTKMNVVWLAIICMSILFNSFGSYTSLAFKHSDLSDPD